jgi:hypothetical protein
VVAMAMYVAMGWRRIVLLLPWQRSCPAMPILHLVP